MNPIVKVVDGSDVITLVLNEGATVRDMLNEADVTFDDDTRINGCSVMQVERTQVVNGATYTVTTIQDKQRCFDLLARITRVIEDMDDGDCLCDTIRELESTLEALEA